MHVCSLLVLVFILIEVSCGRSPMFWTQRISSSVREGIEEIRQKALLRVVTRQEYNGSADSYHPHRNPFCATWF